MMEECRKVKKQGIYRREFGEPMGSSKLLCLRFLEHILSNWSTWTNRIILSSIVNPLGAKKALWLGVESEKSELQLRMLVMPSSSHCQPQPIHLVR